MLRFWQSEFPQLKPNKSGTGQRRYRRCDVEMAMEIKRLVGKPRATFLFYLALDRMALSAGKDGAGMRQGLS